MKTPNAKEQPGLSRREVCVCRRWRAPGGFFQVEGRTDRSPAGVSAQHPSGVEEGGRVWKQAASQVSGSGSWISGLASTGLNRRAHRRGSGDHGDGWIRGRAGGGGMQWGEEARARTWGAPRVLGSPDTSQGCQFRVRSSGAGQAEGRNVSPLPECVPPPPEGNSGTRFSRSLRAAGEKTPGGGRGQDRLLAAGQWAPPPRGLVPAPVRSARAGRRRPSLGRAVSALWPCLAAP